MTGAAHLPAEAPRRRLVRQLKSSSLALLWLLLFQCLCGLELGRCRRRLHVPALTVARLLRRAIAGPAICKSRSTDSLIARYRSVCAVLWPTSAAAAHGSRVLGRTSGSWIRLRSDLPRSVNWGNLDLNEFVQAQSFNPKNQAPVARLLPPYPNPSFVHQSIPRLATSTQLRPIETGATSCRSTARLTTANPPRHPYKSYLSPRPHLCLARLSPPCPLAPSQNFLPAPQHGPTTPFYGQSRSALPAHSAPQGAAPANRRPFPRTSPGIPDNSQVHAAESPRNPAPAVRITSSWAVLVLALPPTIRPPQWNPVIAPLLACLSARNRNSGH